MSVSETATQVLYPKWDTPMYEIYHNPNLSIVHLWKIYGPCIVKEIRLVGIYKGSPRCGKWVTWEEFEELFHFTREMLIVLFPVYYQRLLPLCASPKSKQFTSPVFFHKRGLTPSESHKLNNIIKTKFNLSPIKFFKKLKECNAVLSGSVILKCISPSSSPTIGERTPRPCSPIVGEWTPSDLDIYIPVKNSLELECFLKEAKYKDQEIKLRFDGGIDLNYVVEMGTRLFQKIEHLESATGAKIQLISVINDDHELHISKYFDISILKRYFNGSHLFEDDSLFTLTDKNTEYLALRLQLFREQISIPSDKFSRDYLEENNLEKMTFVLTKYLRRAQKYAERGYPEHLEWLIEQSADLVERCGIVLPVNKE